MEASEGGEDREREREECAQHVCSKGVGARGMCVGWCLKVVESCGFKVPVLIPSAVTRIIRDRPRVLCCCVASLAFACGVVHLPKDHLHDPIISPPLHFSTVLPTCPL